MLYKLASSSPGKEKKDRESLFVKDIKLTNEVRVIKEKQRGITETNTQPMQNNSHTIYVHMRAALLICMGSWGGKVGSWVVL